MSAYSRWSGYRLCSVVVRAVQSDSRLPTVGTDVEPVPCVALFPAVGRFHRQSVRTVSRHRSAV